VALSGLALAADSLTARYPGQPAASSALLDVDLQLRPGERLLLLGPNGAGKSTFIRVFAGLMRPAHGQALVYGRPARHARALVGVVSHATYLYDELTAAENLRFYGELYAVSQPARRATELLEQVGLAHLARERVGRLSRGQQQRVTIARALLHDPPLLLLDEPDTGLDVAAFALLEALATRAGHALVLTTHNLSAGLRLGTRAAVLSRGRLVHSLPTVSVADAPALAELVQRLAAA
jgi:ABC-type multidrug transport system ATPase subunit